MKVLKIIGIVLLALIGLFLILGIFAPNEISTEQSIRIEAPPEAVYNVTSDLATWDEWSPWKEADPTIETTLGETTAGEGATSTWVSENSGSGKIAIVLTEPHEKVGVEVTFGGMGAAQTPFTFEPVEGGTAVTWHFDTKVPYPWNTFNLFQPGAEAIDQDYKRGLELLKTYVEAQPPHTTAGAGYNIREVEMPVRYFAAIRHDDVAMDEIQQIYTEDFGRLMQNCQSKGVEPAGMPCGLYYTWDEATGTSDMASCIPVKEKADLGEGIEIVEIPAGKTLVLDYYGPYEAMAPAYEAMDQYLADNSLEAGTPIYEEYVTDPATEPDPSKWLTRICFPLK